MTRWTLCPFHTSVRRLAVVQNAPGKVREPLGGINVAEEGSLLVCGEELWVVLEPRGCDGCVFSEQ